ncbi:MAG TPA: CaiB/BaiF CoA-transferase family protein [Steroidobacter sp.]
MRAGPLSEVRVVEFAGIGPGPYCAMLLSDLGADVLRIKRAGQPSCSPNDVHARGRRAVSLDLKKKDDRAACLELLDNADVLIEGYRPGVMERLGLGPDVVRSRNPRLIYGRVTGWGQTGPIAHAAGHDINYISITGALAAIGPRVGPPSPPLNLVGDFAGGALFLALGIVSALFERRKSGQGQVIDTAMIDGVASLMSFYCWAQADGWTSARRGENRLDGSAHYYRCYECSDGRWISVGAIEPHFYELLMDKLQIPPDERPSQDLASAKEGSELLAALFKTRPRSHWCKLLEGTDACFAPVLDFDEAPNHPQMRARSTFVEAFGLLQPAPAPRFSRTPGAIQGPPPSVEESVESALARWRTAC